MTRLKALEELERREHYRTANGSERDKDSIRTKRRVFNLVVTAHSTKPL